MTCLVGIIEDGKTYVGTDGYATTEDCERKPIICRKIFKTGEYLVAFSGHIRTGQLLYPESGFRFPSDIYQIPNNIYLWLREFEAIGKDETQTAMMSTNFLIATKNKLYELMIDMQISEIDPEVGYTALGSGAQYAMGSLHTTKDWDIKPKERIEMALNAAEEFVGSCGPPYQIYSFAEAQKKLKSKFYVIKES